MAPETGELVIAIAAVLIQVLGVYLVPNGGRTDAGGSIARAPIANALAATPPPRAEPAT